jgi:hypothetical protein
MEKVRWTCNLCGHKHKWERDEEDVGPGEVTVTCDDCRCDYHAYMYRDGKTWKLSPNVKYYPELRDEFIPW